MNNKVENKPKVLFDKSHGEYYGVRTDGSGDYRKFIELLSNHFIVDDAETFRDFLAGDILFISVPREKFEVEEVFNILEQVKNGKLLILLALGYGIYGSTWILNQIASKAGVIFSEDIIFSPDERPRHHFGRIHTLATFTRVIKHPLTEGLDNINLFFGCSINSDDTGLIYVGDADIISATGEKESPIFTGLECVLLEKNYDKGKIIFIGDASLFDTKFISKNEKFIRNFIKYLREIKNK